MKIAILTQPLGKNYGGVLQAYALQQLLQNWGHDTVILDRVDHYPSCKLFIWRLASLFKCLFYKYVKKDPYIRIISPISLDYITDKRLLYDYSELDLFISKHIIKTKRIRRSNALRKYLLNHGCDLVIVGSDQVWREDYSPCVTDYFGYFLKTKDKVRIISYAASLGQDTLLISENKKHLCGRLLKGFNAVSVRENSAVTVIRNAWGIEPKLVLDPTLLLNKIYYERLIETQERADSNYIFSYILDEASEKMRIINEVSNILRLNVKQILLYPHNEQGNAGKLTSMSKWLSSILDSQFVVTDSYHGCVFAIIFNKPFVVIANKNRGIDRFKTLLGMVNLTNRLIYSISDITETLIKESIDYAEVERIILENRRDSIKFLKSALQ